MSGGANPYRKGSAFERQVAAYLRELGCLVTRNTGSKGDPLAAAFDLVAIVRRNGDQSGPGLLIPGVSLIECKLNGRFYPGPRKKLIETAQKYGVMAVLAKRGKKRGTIEFVQLEP